MNPPTVIPARKKVVSAGSIAVFAELLARLGIRHVETPGDGVFALYEGEGGLELRPPGESDRLGIRAQFPPDTGPSSGAARSPLAKAFGKKVTKVFDLTAGLGGDAYRLAAAGYGVHGWERNAAVFALLESAWRANIANGNVPGEIAGRLRFDWGEGATAMSEFGSGAMGAYFDPMYPAPKRSSALPKRPLQVLRDLLEGDASSVELVESARQKLGRVVVKRPHHASPLVPGASFTVETKLVRFDVYLNPGQMKAAER